MDEDIEVTAEVNSVDLLDTLVQRTFGNADRRCMAELKSINSNPVKLLQTVLDYIECSTISTKRFSRQCIVGLETLNAVISNVYEQNEHIAEDDWKRIADIYANYHCTLVHSFPYRQKRTRFCFQKFFRSRIEIAEQIVGAIVNQHRINCTAHMLLIGLLTKVLSNERHKELIGQSEEFVAEYFKQCLQERRSICHINPEALNLSLSLLSDTTISGHILADIRRSVLRDPFSSLKVLIAIFKGCQSLSSMEIVSQLFIPLEDQLLSKDESRQEQASLAIGNLISKYESPDVVERSITNLIDLIRGAKDPNSTTIASMHRICVLKTIGLISENCICDLSTCGNRILRSLLTLAGSFTTQSRPNLRCHALEQLIKWCKACISSDQIPTFMHSILDEIPRADIHFEKEALCVQIALINIMSVCCTESSVSILKSELFNKFLKHKLSGKFTHHEEIVYFVSSFILLVKVLDRCDEAKDKFAEVVLKVKELVDQNKSILCCHRLECDFHPEYYHNELGRRCWSWLCVTSFLHSSPRMPAFDLSALTRIDIASKTNILETLYEILTSKDNVHFRSLKSNCCRIIKAVTSWTSEKDILESELVHRKEYLEKLLLVCGAVLCLNGSVSKKTLRSLFRVPFSLYDQLGMNHEQYITGFIENDSSSSVSANGLACLCDQYCFVSQQATEFALDIIVKELNTPGYIRISPVDKLIMEGEDGVLADNQFIERLLEIEASESKHMKKESKAYSFKEQLADMELRKELLLSGKLKSQLTERQAKMFKQQLDEESQIRKQLRNIRKRCEHLSTCLSAIFAVNFEWSWINFFTPILEALSKHLQSDITADSARSIMDAIRNRLCLTFEETLILLISVCCFAENPKLPKELSNVVCPKEEAVTRAIQILNDKLKRRQKKPISALVLCAFSSLFQYTFHSPTLLDEKIVLLDFLEDWSKQINHSIPVRKFACSLLNLFLTLAKSPEKCSGFQSKMINVSQQLCACCLEPDDTHTGCDYIAMEAVQVCVQSLQNFHSPNVVRIVLFGIQSARHEFSRFPSKFKLKIAELTKIFSFVKSDDQIATLSQELFPYCGIQDDLVLDAAVMSAISGCSFCSDPAIDCVVSILKNGEPNMCIRVIGELKEQFFKTVKWKMQQHQTSRRNNIEEMDSHKDNIVEPPGCLTGIARCMSSVIEACPGKYQPMDLLQFLVENVLPVSEVDIPDRYLNITVSVVNDCANDYKTTAAIDIINYLEKALNLLPTERSADKLKTCLLVVLGVACKHISDNTVKVKSIMEQLIEALSTPSEMVQEAVANSMAQLIPSIKDDSFSLISKLMDVLFLSNNYAERKGAAYGIAGVMKGSGLLALKQMKIMDKLEDALQDKTDKKSREAALIATTAFVRVLGSMFEIYVVPLLPGILMCLSDREIAVRSAAEHCGRNLMSRLSAQGVRLILPAILEGMQSDKWRTKCGAADLLGAMAFCDSNQLSNCLPTIIPGLIEMMNDTHMKVQASGIKAITSISSVITDPELKTLMPKVIEALQWPEKVSDCVDRLYKTEFMQTFDSVSLALIIPVVTRGFTDRIIEVRKRCGDVIVRICNHSNRKELDPYVERLEEISKQRMFDPTPEIREIASKILASVLKKLEFSKTEQVLHWLNEKIREEKNSMDRMGAAQGICEITLTRDENLLEQYMHKAIIEMRGNDTYAVHGYLVFCLCVSKRAPNVFMNSLSDIMSSVLKALADEVEIVREAAYNVGQSMVNTFCDECAEKLLPEIEDHLFDPDWRIRFSSVKLLSEMIFKIAGHGESSEGFTAERGVSTLRKYLGRNRADRIITELFIFGNDQVAQVAQYSVHVWKVIVGNTNMLLSQILPTFLTVVFERLTQCQDDDVREIISRAIGDLIRRLGDISFDKVLVLISDQLSLPDPQTREGACAAIKEVFTACASDVVKAQFDKVVDIMIKAICDSDATVRKSAASAFVSFDKAVGRPRICEYFMPKFTDYVVSRTNGDRSGDVVDGFVQLLSSMGSSFNLYALNVLLRSSHLTLDLLEVVCGVAGPNAFKFIDHILTACVDLMARSNDKEVDSLKAAKILCNVSSVDTSSNIIVRLCDICCRSGDQNVSPKDRLANSCDIGSILAKYLDMFEVTVTSDCIVQVERMAFNLSIYGYENYHCFGNCDVNDEHSKIWMLAYLILERFIKRLPVSDYIKFFQSFDQSLRRLKYLRPKINKVPGWNVPAKGIKHILPVYKELILNGDATTKDTITSSFLQLLPYVSGEAVRPSLMHLVGSLIRLLGERYDNQLRCNMLRLLVELIPKAGEQVKLFVPQLLPTFTRLLSCESRDIRLQALSGFRLIAPLKTRFEIVCRDTAPIILNRTDEIVADTPWPVMQSVVDFMQTSLFALTICLRQAQPSLTTAQTKQMTTILERCQFVIRSDVIPSNSIANSSQSLTDLHMLMATTRLCGALQFTLHYINEDTSQLESDWKHNPIAKFLQHKIEVLKNGTTITESLASLCALLERFPSVCEHCVHLVYDLEHICMQLYSNLDYRIDALRTLGFVMLARLSCPEESGRDETMAVSTDILLKILTGNMIPQVHELAVRFALKSLTCKRMDESLARCIISLAIGTKQENEKIRNICLDYLLVVTDYPECKSPEKIERLRIDPMSVNPVAPVEHLEKLKKAMQNRYNENNVQSTLIHKDNAELLGWL